MTSAVERAISAVRTIRASGAEEREGHAVDGYAQEAYRAGMRIARLQAMINPITSTTIQVAFLVVLGLGGARVASGAIQVGDMVAFVLFLFMLWFPLGRALTAYSRLQSGLGALQRIEEMVDLPQETDSAAAKTLTVRERTRPEPEADAGAGRPPAIEFDRVSFGYDNGETVLRDVSLTVPAAPAPPWSAPPERASPPCCPWWNASTTPPRAWCGSAARTYETCRAETCAGASATWSSRRRSSPAPSATTCPSRHPTPPTTTCARCCARSTS